LHIKVTVTAEIKQNRFADSFFLAAQGFIDRTFNGVISFRGGENTFGTGKVDISYG
jgi:hypothetical protein